MRPKTFLACSFVLNLALAGALVWRVCYARTGRRSNPESTTPSAAKDFSWAQLESSDYLTFIDNLRRIGCPEQTIREIVSADLDDLYAPRRQSILQSLASGQTGLVERTRAEGVLRQLREEESAILQRLFPSPGARQVAESPTGAIQPVRQPREQVANTNISVPVVFQPVDTNRVTLGADDLESIQRVRNSFVAGLGTNLDVSSPEYLHRWQKAQLQADNLLEGWLGRQTALQYEQAAEQVGAPQSAPAAQ
ncbi:MAG TPA: hypothetical protein VFE51_04145 [Verrucomicrobiae bacterium]|nr:hypothetical protein [Verrucomicrobiae bacterium]